MVENPHSATADLTASIWNASGSDAYKRRDYQEAAHCYRQALRGQPDFPEAWTNLGLTHAAAGDTDGALACHLEALRLAPDLPDAYNNLGVLHYEQGRPRKAASCFSSALRRRPNFPNARINLGVALQAMGRLQAAEAAYRTALSDTSPSDTCENANALNNLGMVLLEQGRVEEAERALRDAVRSCPDAAGARMNLAMAALLNGAFDEGWKLYEARWQVDPTLSATRDIPAPRWTGKEPIAGKTVLLHAEQGFGDTLQFCRYAPLVAKMGARVVLAAPPPLVRVLGSLLGIEQVIPEGGAVPDVDFHCPLLSLPGVFGTKIDTIPAAAPYLTATTEDIAAWAYRLRFLQGRRIGLVWAGANRANKPHAAAIDRRRSMGFATMAPLLESPGCSFVSLQLGQTGAGLHDWTSELHDFADTAALIANLDLVIAVDTAVAHLAGALGKPVWLLNRYDSCWRWLRDRDDSPWHPTMRIFRQSAPGDWEGVVARVATRLEGTFR